MTINFIDKEREPLTLKETYETWLSLKSRYRDAVVLLRREGDYYSFDSDAEIIVGVMRLEKPTTYQNKYLCILPLYNTDKLLKRLIKCGYRIAVCEPQFFSLFQ